MFIGVFFPAMTAKIEFLGYSQSVGFFSKELKGTAPALGVLILLLALAVFGLSVVNMNKLYLLIAAAVELVLTLVMFFPILSAGAKAGEASYGIGKVSVGFGFYLIFLGIILVVVDYVMDVKKNGKVPTMV